MEADRGEEDVDRSTVQDVYASNPIITAVLYFISAIGTWFLRAIQVIAVSVSWFWFLISLTPYLFIVGTITVAAVPYIMYQDIIFEEVDFFARCRLVPFYYAWPRQVIVLIQLIYDPLICWWNAFAWVPYAIIRDVVSPLFFECGFVQTFIRLFTFLFTFFVDFLLDYVLFLKFLQEDFDYTPSGVAWGAFWTSWQQGIYCTCNDLESFFASAWVITIIPPVLPLPAQIFIGFPYSIVSSSMPFYNLFFGPMIGLVASNQMGDFRFWAAFWSAFNGAMNVIQQIWKIVVAILTGQFNPAFPRPNFTRATNNFCISITNLMRSVESINQSFFDEFLPYLNLQWSGTLSMYDSALCVVFRLVNIVLQVIFHLDQVINYPNDPYYDVVIVPQVIETINLIAPVIYKSPVNGTQVYPIEYTTWYWPKDSSLIPGTLIANPTYNISRVSDNVCVYLNRIICDPAGGNLTTCASILGPFDPCCLATQALVTSTTMLSGIFDILRHLYSFYAIATFINNQYTTTALALNAGGLVSCLFEPFAFIPTVGECVSSYFRGITLATSLLADWFFRFSMGLAFLAYYVVAGVQSFLTARGYALASLLAIFNQVTNSSIPNSTSACGTFALNTAFAFPPVGCSNCQVQTNFSKRYMVYDMFNENPDTTLLDTKRISEKITKRLDKINQRISEEIHRDQRFPSSCNVPVNAFTTPNPFTLAPGQNMSLPQTQTNPPVLTVCDNPVPPCFDVACTQRAFWNELYNTVSFFGNFLNSLLQDWDIGFPYFTTGQVPKCSYLCPTVNASADCSEPCPGVTTSLEQDLVNLITGWTSFASCFCNTINEVLPFTGSVSGNTTIYTCRPDVCCFVTRYGDFNAGMAVIMVRAFKALTTGNLPLTPGGPPFPYFTTGPFLNDIDSLFAIAFEIVLCVGNMVRTVFVIASAGSLDIYCMAQNSSAALLLFLKWEIEIIVSLGTLFYPQGNAYFVDPTCNWNDVNCLPNVNNTGFVKSADAFFDALFGKPGGACSNKIYASKCLACVPNYVYMNAFNSNSYQYTCNILATKDQGLGGIPTCLCQLLNSIIPVRPDNSQPISSDNCPLIDVCCGLRRFMFGLDGLFRFTMRFLASTWQRWDNGLPTTAFAFFFCNEFASPIPEGCGILNPTIQQFTTIFTTCACEFFSLIDALVAETFGGFRCFCGLQDGFFCQSGQTFYIIIMQFVTLLRRAPDKTYWSPCQTTVPGIEQCTWAYQFFEPFLQQTCSTAGSLSCFIIAWTNICPYQIRMIFQSLFIYPMDLYISVIEAIQGFVLVFTGYSCSDSLIAPPTIPMKFGLNVQCAATALISLVGNYINAFIADGSIACVSDVCDCWKDIFPGATYVLGSTSAPIFGQGLRPLSQCILSTISPSEYTWGFFQTCCNGTQVTSTCPSYTVRNPQCLRICPTMPPTCKTIKPALPRCDNGSSGIISIDGIFMAILRALRCFIGSFASEIQSIFPDNIGLKVDGSEYDAFIVMLSVVWQLSLGLVSWGVGALGWFLSIGIIYAIGTAFSVVLGLVSVLLGVFANTLATAFVILDVLAGFIALVATTFIVAPDPAGVLNATTAVTISLRNYHSTVNPNTQSPKKTAHDWMNGQGERTGKTLDEWKLWWNSGSRYKKRQGYLIGNVIRHRDPYQSSWEYFRKTTSNITGKEYPEILANLFFGYYTDDCLTDIKSCACRNLDMAELCTWDIENEQVNEVNVSEADVRRHLRLYKFNDNTTTCGLLVKQDDFTLAERVLFHQCLESRILGERLHANVRFIPPDAVVRGWSSIPDIVREFYNEIYEEHVKPVERVELSQETMYQETVTIEDEVSQFREQLRNNRKMRRRSEEGKTHCTDREYVTYDPLYERLAVVEFKWRSGYMKRLLKKAAMNWIASRKRGILFQPYEYQGPGFFDLTSKHLKDAYDAVSRLPGAFDMFARAMRYRIIQFTEGRDILSNMWKNFKNARQRARDTTVPREIVEERQMIQEKIRDSPIYQWWYGSESGNVTFIKKSFSDHVKNVYNARKAYAQENPEDPSSVFNGYGVVSRIQGIWQMVRRRFVDKFYVNQASIDKVRRVYYQVYNILYPGHLTEEQHKRFILDEGCPLISRSVDLASRTVQTCAAQAANQTHFYPTTRDVLGAEHAVKFQRFLSGPFERNDTHLQNRIYPPHMYEWKSWSEVIGYGKSTWKRPRIIPRYPEVPRRTVKRQTMGDDFNFLTWFVNTLDTLFGWNIAQDLSNFFYSFQSFVLNNSTSPEDAAAGNVGLKYWTQFLLDCDWDLNLRCTIGIGLEKALGYTTLGFLIAFIVVPFIFPSIISALAAFGIFILYLIIVGILAYHWSPRCALLTPVFFFGYRIPFWLFPVTVAFPECLVDDVLALLDKYITTCYDFVWPSFSVNGPVCPPCQQRIDIVSCLYDVGMGDGISNFLYLGYQVLGTNFCTTMTNIFSSILGIWFPTARQYVSGKCDMFISASNTQADRLQWCAWVTSPAVVLPLTFVVLGASFIAFVIPSVFSLIIATFYLILASPLSILWGGQAWSTPSRRNNEEPPPDEEEDEEDNDVLTRAPRANVFASIGSWVKSNVFVPLARREFKKLKRE